MAAGIQFQKSTINTAASSRQELVVNSNWFGNPAVIPDWETRGFATPPRGECAVSPDDVWFARY